MSRELRETTTVQQWLDRLPTRLNLHEESLARTEEQKRADLEWHQELFDGEDVSKLICIIVYCVQVLKEINIETALYMLENLTEIIEKEQFLANMPPEIRKFLERVAGTQFN